MKILVSTKTEKNGILFRQVEDIRFNRNILYCKYQIFVSVLRWTHYLIGTFCIVNFIAIFCPISEALI